VSKVDGSKLLVGPGCAVCFSVSVLLSAAV